MKKTTYISQYFRLREKKQNDLFSYEKHIILLTFDDNYVNQTINLILSIMKHHPQDVSYVCICPKLSSSNIEAVLTLPQGIQINCFEVEPIMDTGKWPHCTLFRLFAAWLLDEDITRVVYMDSDILCAGNIKELLEFRPRYIAMCNEIGGNTQQPKQRPVLEYMPARIYCNAGVAVMNLQRIREEYSFSLILEELVKLKDKLPFLDQDFLNYFFCEKLDILNGLEYNFQPYELRGSMHYNRVVRRCKLIHFSARKPWTHKCELYMIKLYLKHSQYPPMVEICKGAFWKSCLHAVVRMNRPIQQWYYCHRKI